MKLKYFTLAALSAVLLASCSDDFLQEKKNYDNTDTSAYEFYSGCAGRVNDAYKFALPDPNGSPSWRVNGTGRSDDLAKCTEEYSGFGCFNNPQQELLSHSGSYIVPDFFQGSNSNIQESAWGRIRNINDIFRGINGSSISQEEKNEFLGQLHFLRAWAYYMLFRWYGGVPIITTVQDPVATAVTPRSSSKETFDFIMDDLDKAVELLTPFTANGGWAKPSENYGRATAGTALALKGRVMLLWASPLFNRSGDPSRWADAYKVIGESLPVINACGYSLAYENNPGTNASNWAKIFTDDANPEAIWFTVCNNIQEGGRPDYARNNKWEHNIRPSNAQGGGGMNPSANMVDLFPMADGKRPASYLSYTKTAASAIDYEPEHPFLNRDPRFYRTFAFPGVRWAFSGDPRNETNYHPYLGSDYELWNYVWFESVTDMNNVEKSGKAYGADNLLDNCKGMYIRKRSDDLDVNNNPRYLYMPGETGFQRSAAPFMEIRYAEVLLNYAEAAAQAGHPDVAYEQLKRIRSRVYDASVVNYGLDPAIASDAAVATAAVLYERQIEFAYEGKRFEDLRRWMLFDGGQGKVDGAPATWNLTGWGGNTCNYLGFTPLNGTRNENMLFAVKTDFNGGLGGKQWGVNGENPDPLMKAEYAQTAKRPAALDLRKPLSSQTDALVAWYDTCIERKERKGDSYDDQHTALYRNFLPRYYFPGMNTGAMDANPSLPQTIGWDDKAHGGMGTFDPLAVPAE